ncbi:hypothetical protein NQ317_017270 [Molorchus minor]|uniref:B box-type domain-containing protein n=1 Tax=Molorchus minor TaxID=1323400 RepID=A0ABQ9JTH1_9CUCU|nr:hypothetical protein NQ317_017270 [Molorchus minor]
MACLKCHAAEKEEKFACDSCKRLICAECAELTSSEVRCMNLKNRKLMFLCTECQQGILMVPTLIKQVSDLQAEIRNLKENNITQTTAVLDQEDLISEMLDRQQRMSNIIVYNVNEPNDKAKTDRINKDNQAVNNILENFEIDKSNLKVFRVGKFMGNKTSSNKSYIEII